MQAWSGHKIESNTKDNTSKLVSIIIPTKNEAKYIEKSLLSLKNQTHPHIETIVVDDLSEDKTAEIADKHADKVILKKTNIAQAKNLGARNASGDVLIFLDADTMLSASWVERALSHLKNHDSVVGRIIPIEKNINARFFGMLYDAALNLTGFTQRVNIGGIPIAVRKNIFERVNGFREDFTSCEDIDFIKKIKVAGKLKIDRSMLSFMTMRRFEINGYFKSSMQWAYYGVYFSMLGKPVQRYKIFR
jgi:glycosyltransferase involved in cell wall biosynthesis